MMEESLTQFASLNCYASIVYGCCILITDYLFYCVVVPFVAAFLGGKLVLMLNTSLDIGPMGEVVIVMLIVTGLLGAFLKAPYEAYFWKHYFSGDKSFQRVLQVRDYFNTLLLFFVTYKLMTTIQDIVSDGGMLQQNLHQGLVFTVLRNVFGEGFLEDELQITPLDPQLCGLENAAAYLTATKNDVGESTSYSGFFSSLFFWRSNSDAGVDVDKQAELLLLRAKAIHGAELLFTVAQLTSIIIKLIYFTSLFTYLRAMYIFIGMQREGEFEEAGESSSSTDIASSLSSSIRDDSTATNVGIGRNEPMTSRSPGPGSFGSSGQDGGGGGRATNTGNKEAKKTPAGPLEPKNLFARVDDHPPPLSKYGI